MPDDFKRPHRHAEANEAGEGGGIVPLVVVGPNCVEDEPNHDSSWWMNAATGISSASTDSHVVIFVVIRLDVLLLLAATV